MRSRFGAGPTTSRLRAPDDGIVASSRGGGWMVDRWLDMLGTIKSLNVSNAAAICLFALSHQTG